jgi:YgiT-type zinc finger domain-containing protein
VVIVVDSARQEERLVTVYEPDPSVWTPDYRRLPAEAMMLCAVCGNGERRPTRHPYVEERGHRVAVVTGVPVEECPACGEIWLAEPVALRLDALLTQMLATETVAVRPYLEVEPTAA